MAEDKQKAHSQSAEPADNTTQPPQTTTSTTSTKKKKRKKRPTKPHILSQFTIRKAPWSYIHLQRLTSSSTAPALDGMTVQLYLASALTQFLGLHGAAIAFDILRIADQDVWIRLAAEDRGSLVAAAGGWVSSNGDGWRVKGWSSWDAGVMNEGGGQDLFAD